LEIDTTGFDKLDFASATKFHHVANDFDEFLSMLGPESE